MVKKIVFGLLAVFLSFGGGFGYAAENNVLYCGVAKLDITPRESLEMDGSPKKRVSQGVHDNLYCRVAAFKMNQQRLVMISCDLTKFDMSAFQLCKTVFFEKFGLKPEEIILNATHTHSGPVLTLNHKESGTSNYRYTQNLKNQLVAAVQAALSNLEPVNIGIERGYCPIGINRRILELDPNKWPFDGGLVKEGRNPEGTVDREVLAVNVINQKSETKCCLFNYACHNRTLDFNNQQITSDFFGLAEQYAEKVLGKNAIVVAFPGAEGDVDPYYVKSGFGTGPGGISETELLGTVLGVEVLEVARKIDHWQSITMNRDFETIKLPAKKPNEYITNPSLPERELNITVASIGDIAFIGLSCEAFTEIGLRIKAASPFKYNFIISLCNGAAGYLPPKEVYQERGYGVSNSPYGPESADMVIKKTLMMLYKQYNVK